MTVAYRQAPTARQAVLLLLGHFHLLQEAPSPTGGIRSANPGLRNRFCAGPAVRIPQTTIYMTFSINQCLLALLLLLPTVPTAGHIVYKDTGPLAPKDSVFAKYRQALDIHRSYLDAGHDVNRYDILTVGEATYLLADGMLDVFRWQGGRWVNQYRGHSHGYNFGSMKFVFDGRLFSYGGYGFWRSHGDLIEFMPDSKEWELIPYSSGLPLGIAQVTDFGIRVFGCSPNYEIDIREGTTRNLGDLFLLSDNLNNYFTLPFDQYTYLPATSPRILADNRTLKLYSTLQNRLRYFGKDNDSQLLLQHIIGNSLFVYDTDGRPVFSTTMEKEFPFFTSLDLPSPHRRVWLATLSAGSLLLVASGLIWYRRRKRTVPASDWPDHYDDNELLDALLAKVGQTLTQEELDTVLGIVSIGSAENKRYRRATLIKEINLACKTSFGRELVERVRDHKDGRQFVYQIGGG